MSLIAKKSETSYEPAPQGTHMAICTQIIDLGTQYSSFYGKSAHKVLIGWELPSELRGEDKIPVMVWKRYTVSLGKKAALRADLESWRSRQFTDEELGGFDLHTILGVPCMIGIVHKIEGDSTYANVSSVMAVPRGTAIPEQIGESIFFDIEDWDDRVFKTFSDNLQKTILGSEEVQARQTAPENDESTAHEAPADDDIPF